MDRYGKIDSIFFIFLYHRNYKSNLDSITVFSIKRKNHSKRNNRIYVHFNYRKEINNNPTTDQTAINRDDQHKRNSRLYDLSIFLAQIREQKKANSPKASMQRVPGDLRTRKHIFTSALSKYSESWLCARQDNNPGTEGLQYRRRNGHIKMKQVVVAAEE